jgi:citrate lyase subunit alpha / citrate CoA-transferase
MIEKMKGSSLPIKTIHEPKAEAEKICGKPQKARLTDEVIAVIKWVDGTVIDPVFRVDR